ncbi:malate/lactate/ureidoglycolate dehydrogenase [Tatumella citrea]|uniref:Malate/lactate/ureidoglycolate dehydrogenase n=1 Tax=Tatumella citrea TaxID=53336 RepID=A0A1Y0LH36_TATCI|nr:malate/lactate/ureidoglycolate dehydrogenase [Tatumella citrea]ARU93363.1 malate/lactate/ureidoglycolate dehydrogenase [Tatumella citrea]ARU97401.1 malate/lactate/ureidoglycolate dehydrogenase [Tatumella citrea]
MSVSGSEVIISASDLHQFIFSLWQYAGSETTEARLIADHLISANLAGHDSHGAGMVPSYMRSMQQGHLQLNQQARLVKDSGVILTFDGQAAFGQVAARQAIDAGIERALQFGMSAVGLHNAHHIGRIGYWAEACAEHGLVSFHFVNVTGDPMVAPFGGSDRRFGTNPFCAIFPRAGKPPLLLDFATSAIAYGKTRVAWNKGVQVAKGSLIDSTGQPTREPSVMHQSPYGALLPFGQHKGYALAVMCEILGGALSGGQTTYTETLQSSHDAIFNCMTSVIINPEAFGAPHMEQEAEAFIEWVKNSPEAGEGSIKVPGEWEAMNRQLRQRDGIPLDIQSWNDIVAAARKAGMPEHEIPVFN